MFKYLLVWFLANYSYENINNTYKSYKSENPIKEMSNFIQHQQYREDQLRKQCNLQFYKIDPQRTTYDDIYDYIKETLLFPKLLFIDKSYKSIINKINYRPIIYMEVLHARSYNEFIIISYNSNNVGKEIIYEDSEYKLIQNGIKYTTTFNYANQLNLPEDRKPTWSLKLGNHTLTISDIK